jgi:hypothetical protein
MQDTPTRSPFPLTLGLDTTDQAVPSQDSASEPDPAPPTAAQNVGLVQETSERLPTLGLGLTDQSEGAASARPACNTTPPCVPTTAREHRRTDDQIVLVGRRWLVATPALRLGRNLISSPFLSTSRNRDRKHLSSTVLCGGLMLDLDLLVEDLHGKRVRATVMVVRCS